MKLDRARAVADAVLFEGYALYPYRPTSTKNQLRWQFGVLAPRAVSEATAADPWWLETQCLVAATATTRIGGRLRFLRVRRRRIETAAGAPIASLEVDGQLLVPWDEGEVCELDFDGDADFALAGDETCETVGDGAIVRRTRAPLSLRVRLHAEAIGGLRKLSVRVENVSECAAPSARRDETLPSATLGTHLLLGVEHGEFVSLIDPPPEAVCAAASCKNVGVYPVLAGAPGSRDLVLASPIIMYDHPAVAPESPGDLFDATEIDEILTLRTLTLTDEEKRLARATDGHVASLIDRVERLPEAAWAKLHGAFRAPEIGTRVRLRPGRRSDPQDMFLDGREAIVQKLEHDVEGRAIYAVTIDGDHGRPHYFYADEVEPLA